MHSPFHQLCVDHRSITGHPAGPPGLCADPATWLIELVSIRKHASRVPATFLGHTHAAIPRKLYLS